MKEDYILQIIDLLHKCDDIALLDLVFQILDKSIQEPA